jgi:hypothetical protein
VLEHALLVADHEDVAVLHRHRARDRVVRVDREDVAEEDAVGRGLLGLGRRAFARQARAAERERGQRDEQLRMAGDRTGGIRLRLLPP